MEPLRVLLENPTVAESWLLIIVGVVAALSFVTLVFSAYAVLLRMAHARRERLWDTLTDRWQQPVLAALLDPEAVPAVHGLVEDRYRKHFVQFVLEYSRRVRGAERSRLRELALPYLPLISARVDHRNAELRTRAVQTLGTLGLPTYADDMVRALGDPSPLVSMVAARYLARREFSELAGPVLATMGRFEGWNRRFLASMLANMGPEVAPLLRAGFADERRPAWMRAVLADALLMQLDPESADVAARILSTSQERELLASSLRLLAALGRPEHASAVRSLTGSPDFVIRAQSLGALGLLSDEADLPLLLRSMGDSSPWVALHAARGVRDAGGSEHLARMIEEGGEHTTLAGQVLFEEPEA